MAIYGLSTLYFGIHENHPEMFSQNMYIYFEHMLNGFSLQVQIRIEPLALLRSIISQYSLFESMRVIIAHLNLASLAKEWSCDSGYGLKLEAYGPLLLPFKWREASILIAYVNRKKKTVWSGFHLSGRNSPGPYNRTKIQTVCHRQHPWTSWAKQLGQTIRPG